MEEDEEILDDAYDDEDIEPDDLEEIIDDIDDCSDEDYWIETTF